MEARGPVRWTMRGAVRGVALAGLMLLAGCLGLPDAGDTPGAVPQVEVAPLEEAPDGATATESTGADPSAPPDEDREPERAPEAEAEAGAEPETAPPPDPETLACRASGGQMVAGPSGFGRICIRPTPDSGRTCRSASDCSEACLARSRTCAPFTPLLGCHEILDRAGLQVLQCVE